MESVEVAIVGAGLTGLPTAATLAKHGQTGVVVFEAASQIEQIGAGIALAGNATRILKALGIDLSRFGHVPPALEFRRWKDGDLISVHEIGYRYIALVGAPYLTLHRATVQRALVDKIRELGVAVRLGYRLVRIEQSSDDAPALLYFANGETVKARVVVGADGVHSTARGFVDPVLSKRYSGEIGFRGVIPVEGAPSFPSPKSLSVWCGPSTHSVCYAVDDGRLINLLAVHTPSELPAWTQKANRIPGTRDEALRLFEGFGWSRPLLELIEAIEGDMHFWALLDLEPARRWYRGRVVLVGDAIHATLPHQGVGAGMGMESGYALGTMLARLGIEHYRQAFDLLVGLQARRMRRIQAWSRLAGRAFKLAGADADRRDRTLWRVSERIGWIHTYDVLRETAKVLEACGISSDEARLDSLNRLNPDDNAEKFEPLGEY